MGKVINLTGEAIADVTSEQVIEGLVENKVSDLFVIGVAEDSTLYIASESKNIGHLFLRMEQAKQTLIEIALEQTKQRR